MAEQTRRKAEGNPPISRHPLFPAIVALWFGALFGLVSLAIRPALIEQIVVAGSIDSIIPMAAAPLGTTMRILLALAMTGLGSVVGALIARRIARPRPESDEPSPLSVPAAKNGVPALAAPHQAEEKPAARKRARGSAILSLSDFDLDGYSPPGSHDFEEPDPQAPAPRWEGETIQAEEPGAVSNHLFEAYSREITARPPDIVDAPEAGYEAVKDEGELPAGPPAPPASGRYNAAERIASAELAALSQVELLERLALAMAERRKTIALPSALETPEAPAPSRAEPMTGADPAPEIEPASQFTTSHAEIASPWEEEPRAEAAASQSDRAPQRVPAALRPVGCDSPDQDDVLPGYVPPRHIALPADGVSPDFARPKPFPFENYDGEEEEEDVLEEGYSSLLGLSRASIARQRLAGNEEWESVGGRAEDDPIAETAAASAEGRGQFSGPGRPDPEETERALRAALSTLQRMSGTA